MKDSRAFIFYIFRFIGIFCLLYFGTQAVIAMAAPEGRFYISFVEKYLDYVSWIKHSLIAAPAVILDIFGIDTVKAPDFMLRIPGGRGVIIAMSCVGYGVYSFWVAFVLANRGSFKKKFIWITGGLAALWFINVLRITLLLLAINRDWPMPLGWNHHTWFNIFAYLLIFILIYFYDRSNSVPRRKPQNTLIREV